MEASPGPAPKDVDTIEEAVELLWAAALPIINAVFMCTIGAVLARRVRLTHAAAFRRAPPPSPAPSCSFSKPAVGASADTYPTHAQGLLKPEGRQVLNQLGFYVFLPALAFSKLAQSVSLEDLTIWWPLPLNVFIKCVRAARMGGARAAECCCSLTRQPQCPDLPITVLGCQ